ncbi:MAG TPA: primosomal protein N', partial [Candidatus Sulfotelmatobacter sp.]|nr:primosomal protein N' [Candidatus Sulfotelmatobacter sp.]
AVRLAQWIADYYLSFFLTALRLVMPPGSRRREKRKTIAKSTSPGVTRNETPLATALRLTPEQGAALEKITKALDGNQAKTFLLHGITGSGKTEVYMQALAHLLPRGKGAIVLVPEISLTPQLVQRFGDRFGGRIAVVHSGLTEKQRADSWRRISAGEAPIVLGARSAIFAPVRDLGLIVIDEEYEHTYKSDKSPRYHTREVADKLAELYNAVVILGSATPSLETYYRAENGTYEKLVLPKRIDDRPLPPVQIVDLRAEMKAGNFGVLSGLLRQELQQTLEKGEQAILFMNRLGYFTFVICRECGLTVECPQCSVSLVYHTTDKKLRCGRCGYSTAAPRLCPRCQSAAIKYFGTGTQRIEDEVAAIYPAARILRYDRDSVGESSHEEFFATFADGKADVLIGTQMVAKGLDIANVTLVGVISADTALSLPDFRAGEHTFQLLTQVAGRAGRHNLPGRVVIQTYNPEHYAIKAAAKHDYEAFYRQEIEHRRELNYPPFSRLISLLIVGVEEKKVNKIADELAGVLRRRVTGGVLGPAPSPIARLRGEWRYRLLLKNVPAAAVSETLKQAIIPDDIKVTVDIDPMSLL